MKRFLLLFLAISLGQSAFAAGELFVGELTAPGSGVTFTTETFIARTGGDISPAYSFGKPYVVQINKVYDSGVDIAFRFSQPCFLDHVSIDLEGNCEGAVVQVFADGQPVTIATPLVAGTNVVVPAWRSSGFTFRFRKEVGYVETASLEVVKRDYRSFKIKDLHLYGAVHLEDAVWPGPQEMDFPGGYLENVTGVTAPRKEFAAENFSAKYTERSGKSLGKKGNIVFELDKTLEKEAFTIDVTKTGALLRGGTSRALLYASEKLLQLTEPDGRIRCVSIRDVPAFPIRGIHCSLPTREQMDFLRRMVKYVFMPMGYNTFFLEIRGTMEYKRHPEINAANCKNPEEVISQKEVAELCGYLRRYGMDVIPLVPSFGHIQFVSKAHPELGEKAEILQETASLLEADKRANVKDYHTACPNHEGYFPLFFDLMEEVIDVVKPDGYVHIGHDEIYELGQCPLCKAEGGARVYAREVTAMHDFLAKKGYGTMMWSDMITEKRYASTASIDLIPKDIICMPFTWYFHLAEEGDSEQPLVDHGFRYLIGNLYSSHFPRFSERRNNKGLLGGQVSFWSKCKEEVYGRNGKIYDLVYTADMLWNRDYRDDFRRTYNEVVRSILPGLREELHNDRWIKREEVIREITCSDGAVPCELSGNFRSASIAAPGSDAVIALDLEADRLHVVHATDYPAEEGLPGLSTQLQMGSYILEYEDGSSHEEPLLQAYNLGCYRWAFGAPRRSSAYRHFGYSFTYPSKGISLKTFDGQDATVWDYALDNPCPEKRIRSLRIRFDGINASKLLVFSVRAVRIAARD